jgi:Tol biopolymer transport system component
MMRIAVALLVTSCIYVDRPGPVRVVHDQPQARPSHGAFVFVTGRDSENHWSNPQIYVTDGKQTPINLTNDANSNSDPSLSPDGKQMVFVASRSAGRELYVMNLDSGETRALPTSAGPVARPRWSAHDIAFESPANVVGTAVWMIEDDGSSPRKLTTPGPSESDDGGLAFVDHGRKIVFSRYNSTTQDRDLYIVNADGGHLRRLTESLHVTETLPVASHDGRLLAYRTSYMDGSTRETISIIALADGELVREIALPPPAHYNISGIDFAADDRSLVFGADASDVGGSLQNVHGELFTIDLDGTHLRRLTKNAAYDGEPATIP